MAKSTKATTNAAVTALLEAGPVAAAKNGGIEKKYLKTRPVCKVTFALPKEAAPEAEKVCVMGEFNDWSPENMPMKRRANGDYFVSVDLEPGHSYRFRYIIDGHRYENHWQADRYERNIHGSDDSVVEV